ncbi:MAG: hypothetical protein KAU20_05530 [Nanoarchaeota archaeon]|nr:hypothetical protein [Nanoarchaeota archaeon]
MKIWETMTINGRKVIVEPILEENGGGFEAYLDGAHWTFNGDGETEEGAVADLINYCMDERETI